ncbi:MAG: type I restriction endonuclease [Candidatus Stygibacter australis]|nr:type I restriction endonuclease [Candidatus Stygibacter australis]MDP8322215.1 type I restriction endonuclease [Candidatus Stygibacter australis]
MNEILQDIRKKLVKGAFQNEEQVRFSLVARILLALGWNIWDPNEVVTEYPVKKFPKTKEESGRVDIALFMNNHSDRTPEVFLEIKAPGKLTGNYSAYEEQLQRYNYYDRSAISILTDGVEWKFYLPSAGGSFDQRLFNDFNLKDDDIDYIIITLKEVLLKDNFRRKAIQSGERMLEEMKLINMLAKVKGEAQSIAKKMGDSCYEVAQKLLKNKYGRMISLEEIEKFWERKVFTLPYLTNEEEPEQQTKGTIIDLDSFDPAGKKPKRVFIITSWTEVNSWRRVYLAVCFELIKRHPETDLEGFLSKINRWNKNSSILALENGKFLHAHLSAKGCISQSIRFLKLHGYEVKKCLKIEI